MIIRKSTCNLDSCSSSWCTVDVAASSDQNWHHDKSEPGREKDGGISLLYARDLNVHYLLDSTRRDCCSCSTTKRQQHTTIFRPKALALALKSSCCKLIGLQTRSAQ
jgi:hypothetical protein